MTWGGSPAFMKHASTSGSPHRDPEPPNPHCQDPYPQIHMPFIYHVCKKPPARFREATDEIIEVSDAYAFEWQSLDLILMRFDLSRLGKAEGG